MASLHKIYLKNVEKTAQDNPVILKISDPMVSTFNEHSVIEKRLAQNHGIRMVSLYPTTETIKNVRLDESTHKLYYFGREVSVVYLRHGYNLHHYTFEGSEMTQFALLAGKSMAINYPSVRTQMLGFKHFQKFILYEPFLEKIGMSKKDVEMIDYHSKEIKHFEIDFNSDKTKMVDFLKDNIDE